LVAAVPEDFDPARILRASGVDEALQLARTVTPADGLVCVTGSLYLVGATQQVLRQQAAKVTIDRAPTSGYSCNFKLLKIYEI